MWCHGPWPVVCLADSDIRTGSCQGVRVDGGHGQHGDDKSPGDAGAHGDYLLVGALISGEHALAPPGGTHAMAAPNATPSRPPGMPVTDRRETTALRTGRLLGNKGR